MPVTVRNPERSRRGRYRLRDPFLRFWFRYVLPNRTALEAGDAELVWRCKIEPGLVHHVALAFEDAAGEHLLALNRQDRLPAVYDRIGPWWRGGDEVDVVAVADDGPLLLAECKWSTRPVGIDILRRLEAKVPVVSRDLERPPSRVDLALFSRSGFTPELTEVAAARSMLLATTEDLLDGI